MQKTVSEYLYERAMTLNGLESQIKRVKLVNTSDSDIATAFISDTSQDAVVTWKPMVSQIAKTKGVKMLFNSSQIPGEIVDLMVVRTDILNRPDGSGQRFAKALAGAWYETTQLMSGKGPATDKVLKEIAAGSQDSLASYKEQLSTTNLFYTPQAAATFTAGAGFQAEDESGAAVLLHARAAGRQHEVGRTTWRSVIPTAPCRARRTASGCASTTLDAAGAAGESSDDAVPRSMPARAG